jgi:hypothetical protein
VSPEGRFEQSHPTCFLYHSCGPKAAENERARTFCDGRRREAPRLDDHRVHSAGCASNKSAWPVSRLRKSAAAAAADLRAAIKRDEPFTRDN